MPTEEEVSKGLDVDIEEGHEIVDPGKSEGQKKDPRKEQEKLSSDTPRFKEVYGKLKESERKIADLEQRIKGSDNSELINEMKRHNSSLEETIKQINVGKASESQDDKIETLNAKLIELKELKKQARETANFSVEVDIDDKISDLKLDIREAKKPAEVVKIKSDEIVSGLSDDDQDEYDLWLSENDWFKNDSKKRASAITFEKKIVKEPEFAESSITEVLEEVKKRVEDKWKPVVGKNSVEGSGDGGSFKIPGSIKLSQAEVNIAKGLGLTIEKYAKQKALINMGRN